jgi:hypothetical protein
MVSQWQALLQQAAGNPAAQGKIVAAMTICRAAAAVATKSTLKKDRF